jgi:alkaline phosphatase
VIATSSVTDATPAGFYAHELNRYMQREIAMDLLVSGIDFFAGGGLKYFIDTTGRDYFKENGVVVDFSKLKRIEGTDPDLRCGFLLAMDRMPAMLEGRGSFLEDASGIAIDFLSRQGKGFFLMIEGSQIDLAGHANRADYLITEMNDFAHAVSSVMEFAAQDGNTLVIVTADHETGGFTLAAAGGHDSRTDYSTIAPAFASTNHSATLVPVLAYGPGAENFSGVYENTEIFRKMVDLILPR